jgi:predicted N-acetyltransferase YhbS
LGGIEEQADTIFPVGVLPEQLENYFLVYLAVLPQWSRQGTGGAWLGRVSDEAKLKGLTVR